MKCKMWRGLAILLAVCLLLGAVPVVAEGSATLVEPLNAYYDSLSALNEALPNTADVVSNGNTYEAQSIVWDAISEVSYYGDYTVTGNISGGDLQGKTVSQTVTIADSRTVYFFDCGAEESSYFDRVKKAALDLKNQSPNPEFDETTEMGYVGTVGTRERSSSMREIQFSMPASMP